MEAITTDKPPIPSAKQCTASLPAVTDALYVIGGKWRLPIIISLSEGAKRFNQLQRTISGISAKVLSDELKALEINGFIHKISLDEDPPVAVYELTGYSDTLQDVMEALSAWGVMHKNHIKNSF